MFGVRRAAEMLTEMGPGLPALSWTGFPGPLPVFPVEPGIRRPSDVNWRGWKGVFVLTLGTGAHHLMWK